MKYTGSNLFSFKGHFSYFRNLILKNINHFLKAINSSYFLGAAAMVDVHID
jgi:hypothetical protein